MDFATIITSRSSTKEQKTVKIPKHQCAVEALSPPLGHFYLPVQGILFPALT